jgi:hypothetical protein
MNFPNQQKSINLYGQIKLIENDLFLNKISDFLVINVKKSFLNETTYC